MGMSQIPAECLKHYTMLYRLNSNKLKDKVVGHQSAYRKKPWEIASVTSVLSVLDIRMQMVTLELISMPLKY